MVAREGRNKFGASVETCFLRRSERRSEGVLPVAGSAERTREGILWHADGRGIIQPSRAAYPFARLTLRTMRCYFFLKHARTSV